MKHILTDNILQNVRKQRFPKSSFDHLMSSYEEGFQALLTAIGCNPASVTILSGCGITVNGQDFSMTAGWAAYNNEIFEIDAANFTAPAGQTAVFVIEETFSANDPIRFDDNSEFNVNQIRKLKMQSGASGSGLVDWSGLVDTRWKELSLLNDAVDAGSTNHVGNRRAPSYKKDITGRVWLTGVVEIGSGGHIATLPLGFRPLQNISLGFSHSIGHNTFPRIGTDGVIDFTDSTSCILDGISFDTVG